MGAGLPVEGERGPYVGSALIDVPTCRPDDQVGAVAARLADGEGGIAVVAGDRIAIGWVDRERLAGAASPSVPVLDVLEPVPESLRPSTLLAQVDARLGGRLVTTPEGRLLGALDLARLPD